MKRIRVIALLMVFAFTYIACNIGETKEKNFEYRSNTDGITITKYIGKLKEVRIPERIDNIPVTRIGETAFKLNTELTSIVIPDSVTVIGREAFSNCTNLKSVTIPENVSEIGENAFLACKNLTGGLTIPDTVYDIHNGTFAYCESLIDITLPKSLRLIGEDAFYGCHGLTSVVIPDSVLTIGDRAFMGCNNLHDIAYRGVNYSIEQKTTDSSKYYDLPYELFANGSGALLVYVSPNMQMWELRNSLSNSRIDYSILKYRGQEIIDVSVTSGAGGVGVYLAFTEEQKPVVDGNSVVYNGGTILISDSFRNYTLANGILDIME